MIEKTKKGYQVKSEEGKNLSKDNLTKKEAEERLRQVEAFKHMPKRKK
jgi:phosphosulfolactate synthase (CoM biosynthesis protein A)